MIKIWLGFSDCSEDIDDLDQMLLGRVQTPLSALDELEVVKQVCRSFNPEQAQVFQNSLGNNVKEFENILQQLSSMRTPPGTAQPSVNSPIR